jgi:hypothetical protein
MATVLTKDEIVGIGVRGVGWVGRGGGNILLSCLLVCKMTVCKVTNEAA